MSRNPLEATNLRQFPPSADGKPKGLPCGEELKELLAVWKLSLTSSKGTAEGPKLDGRAAEILARRGLEYVGLDSNDEERVFLKDRSGREISMTLEELSIALLTEMQRPGAEDTNKLSARALHGKVEERLFNY